MNSRTTYMGLELKNPLIAGASSLTSTIENLREVEQSGAAAVVLKSLFQEQLELENYEFEEQRDKFSDGVGPEIHYFYPHTLEFRGIDSHLLFAKDAKKALSIPVIASINTHDAETMVNYAMRLQDTGVDGLELNVYRAPEFDSVSGNTIEEQQIEAAKKTVEAVRIPVSVKITPYYTNTLETVQRFDKTGIKGIVLFNRPFQAAINTDSQTLNLTPFLSTAEDCRLPIHFTGQLFETINSSICASTGIFDAPQAISSLLAGADCFQVCSTLYKNGTGHIQTILRELNQWMETKGYLSMNEFRGKLSRSHIVGDPWAYKRTQYVDILWRANQIVTE